MTGRRNRRIFNVGRVLALNDPPASLESFTPSAPYNTPFSSSVTPPPRSILSTVSSSSPSPSPPFSTLTFLGFLMPCFLSYPTAPPIGGILRPLGIGSVPSDRAWPRVPFPAKQCVRS